MENNPRVANILDPPSCALIRVPKPLVVIIPNASTAIAASQLLSANTAIRSRVLMGSGCLNLYSASLSDYHVYQTGRSSSIHPQSI